MKFTVVLVISIVACQVNGQGSFGNNFGNGLASGRPGVGADFGRNVGVNRGTPFAGVQNNFQQPSFGGGAPAGFFDSTNNIGLNSAPSVNSIAGNIGAPSGFGSPLNTGVGQSFNPINRFNSGLGNGAVGVNRFNQPAGFGGFRGNSGFNGFPAGNAGNGGFSTGQVNGDVTRNGDTVTITAVVSGGSPPASVFEWTVLQEDGSSETFLAGEGGASEVSTVFPFGSPTASITLPSSDKPRQVNLRVSSDPSGNRTWNTQRSWNL